MKNSGTLTGLLGLVIAIIAFADARGFPLQNLENGLGAAFFPLLIILFLASLSLASLLLGVLGKGKQQELQLQCEGTMTSVWLLLCLILFAGAFSHFGLLVPAMVFLAGASYLLGAPLEYAVLIGAAGGVVVRVLFINVLNVQLI